MDAERVGRRVAVGVVVGAYAWWAVGLEPFSAAATWAVLAAGLVAGVVGVVAAMGARGQRRSLARSSAGDVRGWALWLAAMAAWQLAAYLQSPREDHPTVSSLTNAVLSTHPTRALGFVLWLLAMRELARL